MMFRFFNNIFKIYELEREISRLRAAVRDKQKLLDEEKELKQEAINIVYRERQINANARQEALRLSKLLMNRDRNSLSPIWCGTKYSMVEI